MAKVRKIKGREGYFLDYRLRDRTRIIKKASRSNRRGAEKELALIVSEIETKPGLRRLKKTTVGKMCEEYLGYAKVNHLSWKADQSRLKTLVAFWGPHTELERIASRQIERFKASRLEKVKPATVNKEIGLLKHLLNLAVEWGYLYENPARKVKPLRENNMRLRYLANEEINRLVASASGYLKPIITLAVNTGMRRGEIFNLKWSHVDLKNRFVEIIKSKNGDKRVIPINKTLLEALHRLPRRIDSPYVFPGKKGKKLTDVKKSFRTAMKKAEIEDFCFHDLRHTFASHLVMAGVPLLTVAELLGHKSIEMTKRYSHLSPNHKAAAVRMLDSLNDEKQEIKSTSEGSS